MRGRIKADLAPEMVKYITGPGILADNERSFYNMADINRAHVLMLVEESQSGKNYFVYFVYRHNRKINLQI